MSTIDWAKLGQMASEAGYSTTELPVGPYTGTVTTGKFTPAAGKKKAQYGFRFKVLGGPYDGESVWLNQSVPDGSEKNPGGAAAMFVKILGLLGAAGLEPEAGCLAPVGKSYDFEVGHRPKADGSGNWVDVKNLKPLDEVPAAPAVVNIPAPTPVPGTPLADGTVADSPEVAALKAQLAAAQNTAPAAGAAPWTGARPV